MSFFNTIISIKHSNYVFINVEHVNLMQMMVFAYQIHSRMTVFGRSSILIGEPVTSPLIDMWPLLSVNLPQ